MKILFCDIGYAESRTQLAPLIPAWHVATCAKDAVAANLSDVDVIVPYGSVISSDVINRGSFGLIQQFGVGLETVDVPAATAAGVWVARIPSGGTGNAESVAEHAILLMLALARRMREAQAMLDQKITGQPAGKALLHKTAAIVGLGDVGAALARRLHAFGMRLCGVRANPTKGSPPDVPAMKILGPDRLHDALREADFVIVCVRLEDSNRNLIDRGAFDAMKRGAILVNVARGGLVDSDALLEALASGRIGGAGLDVFSQEPVDPQHAMFHHNVIATPHIAGVTDESYRGIAHAVAANLYRFAIGEPPRHAVNAPPVPRWPSKPASAP
ncbi:MAG: NAD(P)-binding domain-containing protein [Candidatus Eremiobacteraeota bacterium]|nr:NAD(P)-binding domain-containing protein [Candidatus Eremiobacteraeota bacterium]MBC5805996.1 NAD(P)-binding domain-containing protein [Candidatus Eremiobacteraeota bacterium]MBC5807261.1 NAD(P)-binding domain-containing protein [Candidatus Eremiobacteraeota bacterium]PZR61951.1 MAG: hydroxyacid dehydrogenase [Candidatus Eremiobacter sp. RRmetagenome_bin22]